MAKILFVGQSTRHFSYYSSSIYSLSKRGHKFYFRYDKHFSKSKLSNSLAEFLNIYPSDFNWLIKPNKIFQAYVFFFRELATYIWYLSRTDQSNYYVNRWANLFPYPVNLILKQKRTKKFLQIDFVKKFVFYLAKKNYRNNNIKNDILKISPDIIYASPCNLRFSSEVNYIQQAKKLKIPVVYSIYSWDNLTNKGMFHVNPDLFLVWNHHHKSELIQLHQIDKIPITIIGSQLFDKWLLVDPLISPTNEIINLAKKPYILYLGSSSNIIEDESEILNLIVSELKDINSSIKLLFKPHPFHFEKYKKLDSKNIMVLSNKYGLSETLNDIINFKYLIENSLFVIGVNTSGFLDSIVIGKQTFAFTNHNHVETQKESAHYKVLRSYNVLQESSSLKEMFIHTKSSNNFFIERDKFLIKFVWPIKNISAGENASNEIENFIISRQFTDI